MRSFGRSVFAKSSVGAAAAVVLASLFTSGPAVATPTQEYAPTAVAAPAFTPTLTYVACPVDEKLPPRTRCAALTVPLDWQSPDDGRTIDIAVRITRAKNNPGSNGLTWNIGGPGAAVVEGHRSFYSKLPASIRKNFDWVSFDPRGVGLSEPKLAGCTPGPQDLPPLTGPVDWDAHWTKVEATDGAAAAACFDANPDAAPYLGTWQVVRDMDALRASLRYDRWNYWGMSYGTRLGNTYARTFPDKLRAFIEDGAVMANESITRFGSTTPAGDYLAVQIYASIMGKDQARKQRVILSYFNDDGDAQYNRFRWSTGTNALLREPSNYPLVKSSIDSVYAALVSGAPDSDQRARRAMRRLERLTADPQSDAFLNSFINCADMHDRPTPAQLAAMSRQAEQDYGTAYGYQVVRASVCLGLPSGYSPSSENGDTPVSLANRALFILATGDAGTPWAWGRSLANTYTNSRTVTLNSTIHVSLFFTPSTCVNDAGERYLLTLQLPRTDLYCPFVKSPAP